MKRNIFLYILTCLIFGSAGLLLSYGFWMSGVWYWAYGALPRKPLFSISSEEQDFRDGLNTKEISNLRKNFEAENIEIPAENTISIKLRGLRWEITDEHGETYIVKKEQVRKKKYRLSVYRRGEEYQNTGGHKEGIRLLLLLLFLFLSQCLLKKVSGNYWGEKLTFLGFYRRMFFARPRWLQVFCILAVFIVVIYHPVIGPIQMFREFNSTITLISLSFKDHFKPYLGYLFYTLTMYILIALPMFMVIAEAIIDDRRRIRSCVSKIEPNSLVDTDRIALKAAEIEASFLNLQDYMARILNKYMWIAIMILCFYYIEIQGGLILTLACWTQALTKFFSWVFIVVILPYFILTSYWNYRGIYYTSRNSLITLANCARDSENDEALNAVNNINDKFAQRSPLSFFKSLAKTGGIALVLTVAIIFSLWKILVKDPINLIQTWGPYPVSNAIIYVYEGYFRPSYESDTINETSRKKSKWSPYCSRNRPNENLIWKGKRIIDFYRKSDLQRGFKTSEFGGGHQIWFEAEDYDERNPDRNEFYRLVDKDGAFGKAINRTSIKGGMIRYTFDISAVGGKGGTWYFWGRVINPNNTSDYMLVAYDPGDPVIPRGPPFFPGGHNVSPFDNNDDRIFESSRGPPWEWAMPSHKEGHTKKLKNGENTMYIFHRQGDESIFWDVFMWTDSADYVPTDEDYQNAEPVKRN